MGLNTVYNLLFNGGAILFSPVLLPWVLLSENRRKTVLQRLWLTQTASGSISVPPAKRPIWVHALSVGEVLSAVPLVLKLVERFPDRPVVLTASTRTGYDLARERLAGKVASIYFFPHDFHFSVRRAAAAIDPAVVVLVETDLWPNFLARMARQKVPVVLVNGRLSDRSLKGYQRVLFFMGPMFSSLTTICTQSAEDARRFGALGVPGVRLNTVGNLKFDQAAGPHETGAGALSRSQFVAPHEKILLAGSTHPGEEEILLDACRRLRDRHPNLRLILAPRDPKRAGKIIRRIQAAGDAAALLTSLSPPAPFAPGSILVVGKMGLLARLYSLAYIAFVGGSLTTDGGHNPLEAAAWGKPVLFGPDMRDFKEISQILVSSGGALRVENEDALVKTVDDLLETPARAAQMGRDALDTIRKHRGAVAKTLDIIARYLD